MNARVNEIALNVLIDHIDFFTSPFTNPEKFQLWAEANKNNDDFMALNEDLREAFNHIGRFNTYRHALVGDSDKPSEAHLCLLYGYREKIKNILILNDKLRDALIKHENNPCMRVWYEYNFGKVNTRKHVVVDPFIAQCHTVSTIYMNYLKSSIKSIKGPANQSLQLANRKLAIIKEAKAYLSHPNLSDNLKIESFVGVLKNNKDTLSKRRDSGFMTFIKGLGLIGASIFTLGIASYAVYHRLFGKYATHANLLVQECDSIHKNSMSA